MYGIGRNFKESFQKAIRSLETGLVGLDSNNFLQKKNRSEQINLLKENRPNKFLVIAECIRKKIDLQKIIDSSNYDSWFVREIYELVQYEKVLKNNKMSKEIYIQAKEYGFSDEKILQISRCSKNSIFNIKKKIDFSLHLETLIHVQENFNPKLLICTLPGTVLRKIVDLRMKLKLVIKKGHNFGWRSQ